ncbi:hypothetical protein GCM10009872_51910 [Actinopolymorpha rutila]
MPSVPTLAGMRLQDPTVMQAFAWDPAHRVWIFAQLTAGRPATSGDLTLTKVSATGARLGWMHLRGFGHGLTISIENAGAVTYVWTETHAVANPVRGWALAGAYGNQIARFAWRSGVTLTPSSTKQFGVNAGAPEQTPSVDAADGLIAIQYWSTGLHVFRWAVYDLAAFKRHQYTALARFTVPPTLAGTVEQGWALASRTQVGNWQGTNSGKPGNATFATISSAGSLTGRVNSTVAGEPEGMTRVGPGNLCTGFASGPTGARRANVYCNATP